MENEDVYFLLFLLIDTKKNFSLRKSRKGRHDKKPLNRKGIKSRKSRMEVSRFCRYITHIPHPEVSQYKFWGTKDEGLGTRKKILRISYITHYLGRRRK